MVPKLVRAVTQINVAIVFYYFYPKYLPLSNYEEE